MFADAICFVPCLTGCLKYWRVCTFRPSACRLMPLNLLMLGRKEWANNLDFHDFLRGAERGLSLPSPRPCRWRGSVGK